MLKNIKNFLNTNIFFLILLTIVVFSLYGKSINFKETGLDDTSLIIQNINFISDFKNIPKLFVMSPFYDNFTTYYRPMLSVSFAIEAFFVRDNLKLYHITNIILFILSLYLFYLFCLELKLNSIITKFVLLIIAVHPMFVSVVVWIPGRNDSLLTLFFISSFIFFIRYLNTQKIIDAFLFGLFFVLSLYTKETFILLIPLYFIYLFLYGYKNSKKNIAYLVISLIPFVLIFFILRNISVATLGYQYYIINISKIFLYFVKESFIYFYNFFVPEYTPIMLFNANLSLKVILYNCLFIFITIFLLYKKIIPVKAFIFSLLLILLSLFPTFFARENIYLNHRFFICSLGFLIISVSVLDYLVKKLNKIKIIFILFFFIYFISLFFISYKYEDKYKNDESFWINAYIDSPNYHVSCQRLSKIYLSRGDIEKAKYYMEKAINLKSTFRTLIDYANFLIAKGDLEEAEAALLQLEIDMEKNKDAVYYPLSIIYYKKEDYKKAEYYALMAYEMKPYDINYSEQLIKIYDVTESYDKELKIYEKLLGYDKKNSDYKNKINELKEKINNRKVKNA